jgi:hypothetical protein
MTTAFNMQLKTTTVAHDPNAANPHRFTSEGVRARCCNAVKVSPVGRNENVSDHPVFPRADEGFDSRRAGVPGKRIWLAGLGL